MKPPKVVVWPDTPSNFKSEVWSVVFIDGDGQTEIYPQLDSVETADGEAKALARKLDVPLLTGQEYIDAHTELLALDKVLDRNPEAGPHIHERYTALMKLLDGYGEGF